MRSNGLSEEKGSRGKHTSAQHPKLALTIWIIIAVSLSIHITCLILDYTLLKDWEKKNYPVHASVEISGSLIAFFAGLLVLLLDKRKLGTSYNTWISGALLGMGLLDGMHAMVLAGQEFVWLHTLATFLGGLLFSLVWLPKSLEAKVSGWWIWAVFSFALAVGVCGLVFPNYSPPMLVSDDGGPSAFSVWAVSLNIAGGVLLHLAAFRLFMTYFKYKNTDDLLFCLHTLLFGAAAVMFQQSELWDVTWWGWHVLRLMAYGVALWFLVLTFLREHHQMIAVSGELQDVNQLLETRVEQRTAAITEEVNQRIETEKRLRESKKASEDFERRFRLIFESASSGLLLVDQAGTIRLVNKETQRLFGYSRDELVGQPIELLVPDRIKPNHKALRDAYTSNPRDAELGVDRNPTGRHKSGKEIPVEISLRPLEINGELRVLASVDDVSERKKFEEELIEARDEAASANRAKSQFLANMSHEIRTPLNAVIGLSEVLLRTELESHQRDHLRTVVDSAESLLTVINDILDFSKIEAGKLELEAVPFNLHDVVGDTLKALAIRVAYRKIELACFIDPRINPNLIGDPARLRQILTNLVGNAIKFTDEGEIVVRVSPFSKNEQTTLRFSVTDTGIGIEPEKLERLFEPFSQADASTTRKHGGTGLGLSICTQLVELMGGEITAESEPDKGSTFFFTAAFSESKTGKKETELLTSGLSGKRVLIVDDNETNREILFAITKAKGMEPVLAATADDVIKKLNVADPPFDLLLSDVHMPETDGFQLVERIRQDENLDPLPVVLISSAGEEGDQQRCTQLKIAAQLLKPVKQSELYQVISRVLGVVNPDTELEIVIDENRESHIPPQKILLAEDSLVNQRVAIAILQEHSHDVTIAENGKLALELWREHDFDLILMDVEMPEMDGLEATRQLRIEEEKSETPADKQQKIIAMTAHAIEGDREKCLTAGMNDYVSKPVRREDLFDAIARHANLHRTRQEMSERENEVSNSSWGKSNRNEGGGNGSGAEKVVSWENILSQVDGNKDVVIELAETFIKETGDNLGIIEAEINGTDRKKVSRAIHTLKGGMRMFGAEQTIEVLGELSQAIKSENRSQASMLLIKARESANQVTNVLQEFIETGQMR